MRILIVEDDPTFANILKRFLERERYNIDLAPDGEEAIYKAKVNSYELIILDLRLPKKNGFEVCRALRQGGKDTLILMVTAVSEEFGATAGLDLGADDYLRKPFDLSELSARIRALLRRKTGQKTALVKYGNLTFDPRAHRVFLKESEEIRLNPKEYQLLFYFINHQNEALTTAELVENIWGTDLANTNSNSLEVYIHRIRKVLEDCGHKDSLVTLRGHGYKLIKLPHA